MEYLLRLQMGVTYNSPSVRLTTEIVPFQRVSAFGDRRERAFRPLDQATTFGKKRWQN
jgi:hypothetical protein